MWLLQFPPSDLAFVVIPLLLAGAFTWAVKVACSTRAALAAALGTSAWMSATWALAARGVLLDFESTPPPFALLVAAIAGVAGSIAASPLGARLAATVPLWALVAVQSFRLPLELAMHALAERGVMPTQMSYAGRNWDIVTGITAIVVAGLLRAGLAGRPLVAVWNVMGTLLLLNIIVVAILSTPRFRYFGNENLNVFVMSPPYIWLPTIMVLAALAGHLLIFRVLGRSVAPR